ncbi:MAG: class Ib ribonucleoside-diphosphate reductase assembly flavoprotein NrdI [Alphaproteobacteria bacterium]|nr:class Ib ribonucleoside-diphosphate reductase assembly flavoprotein NrdI [Alphaproteobacteria bacterium]
MSLLVYYSSNTGNTHRFVEKVGFAAKRIPTNAVDGIPAIREPYVLVVPTYAGGEGQGAVPKQVIRFLNDPENRSFIRGVVAAGNRNFGEFFGYAGSVIASKCKVPVLHRFELLGTEEDVKNVREKVERLWQ